MKELIVARLFCVSPATAHESYFRSIFVADDATEVEFEHCGTLYAFRSTGALDRARVWSAERRALAAATGGYGVTEGEKKRAQEALDAFLNPLRGTEYFTGAQNAPWALPMKYVDLNPPSWGGEKVAKFILEEGFWEPSNEAAMAATHRGGEEVYEFA